MQLIRMILISVLAGLFAAGLVWLLGDLLHKLSAPPPKAEEDSGEDAP